MTAIRRKGFGSIIIYAKPNEAGKQVIIYEESIRSESDLWDALI